jgi:hypothetical protein
MDRSYIGLGGTAGAGSVRAGIAFAHLSSHANSNFTVNGLPPVREMGMPSRASFARDDVGPALSQVTALQTALRVLCRQERNLGTNFTI